MKPYFGLKGHKLRIMMLLTLVIPCMINHGYDQGVTGGLLTLPSFVAQFPAIDTVNATPENASQRATLEGSVVALYTLGAVFGALSCLWVGDRFGRRRTIAVGITLNIVGYILQSTSFSLGQFIVGRIVTGFGLGMVDATVPMWQSECSPASHRGSFVVVIGIAQSIGIGLAAWLDFGFFYTTGPVSWRFPLIFPTVIDLYVLFFLFSGCLPESPRWLVKKGRVEEARLVLATLEDEELDSPMIIAQIQGMEASRLEFSVAKFRYLLKLGKERLLHRTFISAVIGGFQQLSGATALAYYTDVIYEEQLGLSGTVARILSGCLWIFLGLCCIVPVYTIDRLGRRTHMMFGALGMGIVFIALAGLTAHPGKETGAAAAAFIYIYMIPFAAGGLGVPFLYQTEVATLAYRAHITSIGTVVNYLINFMVAEVTPVGFTNIGYKYYIIYAIFNIVLYFPFVYFFCPETKNRELEEMDEVFQESRNLLDPPRVERRLPKRLAENMRRVEMTQAEKSKVTLDDGGVSQHAVSETTN